MTPILFFLHIPKTAGTSLYQIFSRQYPGRRLVAAYPPFSEGDRDAAISALGNGAEVFFGHLNFGIHRLLGVPGRYLSMLRQPVDRVVSYFNHQRRHPHAEHFPMVSKGMTLQDLVSQRVTVETNNHMTRMLAGYLERDYLDDPEVLAQALHNLQDEFVFAGITERFEESVAVMAECLGWQAKPPGAPPRANRAPDNNRSELDLDTRRLIERDNRLDLALYRAVADDLQRRIDRARVG